MKTKEYLSEELVNVLEPIAELLNNDYSKAYGVSTEVLNRMAEDGCDTEEVENYMCSNLNEELFEDAEKLWKFMC